jgi:hypothetical protein
VSRPEEPSDPGEPDQNLWHAEEVKEPVQQFDLTGKLIDDGFADQRERHEQGDQALRDPGPIMPDILTEEGPESPLLYCA